MDTTTALKTEWRAERPPVNPSRTFQGMAGDDVRIARVIRGLAIIIGILACLDLGTIAIRTTGHDHVMGLIPLIDVNEEQNIPTFFSGLLWIFDNFTSV